MLECARHRHNDSHNSHNNREDHSTKTVITQRIEDLCSGQDVEANKQDIVRQTFIQCQQIPLSGFTGFTPMLSTYSMKPVNS